MRPFFKGMQASEAITNWLDEYEPALTDEALAELLALARMLDDRAGYYESLENY
jgi:hypothetical protein